MVRLPFKTSFEQHPSACCHGHELQPLVASLELDEANTSKIVTLLLLSYQEPLLRDFSSQ
jgi:hypothetical protein